MPGDQFAIERALRLLRERLEFAGASLTVLLVGGGAGLNILGLVFRTTKDVDVIGLVRGESDASTPILERADPLPSYLAEATALVASAVVLSGRMARASGCSFSAVLIRFT